LERLQKYLARCGIASRRQAEEMILEGKVKVNNKIVTKMGIVVNPEKDRIEADGRPVRQKETLSYYLLYKPAGVVSTCSDPQRRKTVLDLIPNKGRLYPVGRLDYQTEGLLLLTDDGELANRLTHPRYRISKTYLVEVSGLISEEKAALLERGVELEDGPTQPAKVKIEYYNKTESRFFLTISEGRNHQVRRMCEAVGLPVTYLCRVRMSFLDLNGLAPGEYRRLGVKEVERLRLDFDKHNQSDSGGWMGQQTQNNPMSRKPKKPAARQTGRQAVRQTDRQTNRQADRQAGRQPSRQAIGYAGKQYESRSTPQAAQKQAKQAGARATSHAAPKPVKEARQTYRQNSGRPGRPHGTTQGKRK
jgi:pseudouridine synthase